jgi:hypothetical protein
MTPPAAGRFSRRYVRLLPLALAVPLLIALWMVSLHRRRPDESPKPPARAVPAGARRVVVRSSLDQRPLPGAVVAYTRTESGRGQAVADNEGVALLEQAAGESMTVGAPGFIELLHALPAEGKEAVVFLTPAGGVEVKFIDDKGGPVPGIEVELEPPADGPPRGRQASEANGVAAWRDLRPSNGYRLNVLTPRWVEFDSAKRPPIDAFRPVEEPARRSNPFSVLPGQTLKMSVRVREQASVSGTLFSDAGGISGAVIRLYDRIEIRSDDRRVNAHEFVLQSVVGCSPDGAFRISPVPPGFKRVEAYWRQATGRFSFASVQFVLHPREDKQLGIVRAQEGITVRAQVHLAGREALPEELRASPLEAVLSFTNLERGGEGRSFSTSILAPVDQPFELGGLATGDLLAEARMNREIPGITWVHPGPQKFDLETSAAVDLTIEARARTSLVLRAAFPPGASPAPLNVFLFPEEEVGGDELPAMEAGSVKQGVAERTYEVPRGEYTVWILSAPSEGKTDPGFFGEGKVTVAAGKPNELRVDLGAATSWRGSVRDKQGRPVSTELRVKAYPFLAFKNPEIRVVKTDLLGNFVVTGLPPSRALRTMSSDATIQSGSPGTETRADLRLSR